MILHTCEDKIWDEAEESWVWDQPQLYNKILDYLIKFKNGLFQIKVIILLNMTKLTMVKNIFGLARWLKI